jgi:hypothetical protein
VAHRAAGRLRSALVGHQSEPIAIDRHQMVERARREPRIGPAIDRSLIDRARNGDLDAFESIVRARMDAGLHEITPGGLVEIQSAS